jgi:Na+/H+-dicarboxylate symporter
MAATSPGKPDPTKNSPQKRRLGLAEQIMIGLVLGVAAGIFFGEKVA